MKKKSLIKPSEIKKLRNEAGLTQKQVAELFNITIATWQKKEVEKGTSTLSTSQSEYIVLQLLANEHPDYVLHKRDKSPRN